MEYMFVPINDKGRLSSSSFFGSRYKLSALQDSFYAQFSEFGIKRGVRRAVADHRDVDA